MATQITQTLGKDIIYICQTCENREKEFAYSDRNYKYCSKCGGTSVKSTLVDSYNYIVSPLNTVAITEEIEDDE